MRHTAQLVIILIAGSIGGFVFAQGPVSQPLAIQPSWGWTHVQSSEGWAHPGVHAWEISHPHPFVTTESAVCASGTILQGVDVYSGSGTINWTQVRAAGISFSYVKAGEGLTYVDPNFSTNYAGAKGAGLVVGAYYYFHPGDDPTTQANNFLNELATVGFSNGDLVPAVDFEVTDGLTQSAMDASLQTFVNVLQNALGVPPIIYTYPYFWNTYGSTTAFSANPLWIANYGVTCPAVSPPWSTWVVWQWSDSGTVAGIPGNQYGYVDRDESNGALPLYGGGSGQTAVMTTPSPGSTLSGSAASFAWTAGSGVSQYFLYVGSTLGSNDLYGQSQGTNRSVTVTGLPTDGRTLYVRLWSLLGSTWQYNDYTYTAYGSTQSCLSLTTNSNPSNGGSVSANPTASIPCNFGYYLGQTAITLTANPAYGYQFDSWSGSGGSFSTMSQTSATFTITSNAQVTAKFVSTPTTGTINVNATLDGSAWSGTINLSVNGPTYAGFGQVPGSVSNELPGSYTATYNSGGPTGATLNNITPSATQTLGAGGAITFTVNFMSPAPNPVPSITTVSPAGVTAGGPDFTLTVDGSGIIPASVVDWNGAPRQTSYVSSTRVTALITANDIVSQGSATVTVFNPAPGGGTSAGAAVTIQPAAGQCSPTFIASCPYTVARAMTTSSCTAGKRGSNYYTDVFSLAGTQGSSVQIDLSSSAFDTYLYLVRPDGTIAASNDDSNGTTNSEIIFTLTTTGTWTIEATSYYQFTTGTYTLSVTGCGGGSLAAPTGLVVIYNHNLFNGTPGVNVSWTGVANAVDYEAEVNGYVLDLQTSGTSTGIYGYSEPVCYVIRVRAVNAAGQRSAWSVYELATSVIFSDDPLGSSVSVRAAHFNELRTAVATVRAAAGLATFSFTGTIAPGNPVRAIHLLELRNALNDALSALSLPTVLFPDPTANVTPIAASDLQRLRNAMK